MANRYTPSAVLGLQFDINEVGWRNMISTTLGDITGKRFQTDGNLFHIANPASGDLVNSTQSLLFKFNITEAPAVISGLELRVMTQRNGRATDKQIQLSFQDQPIGNNNFKYITDEEGHLPLHNDATYGGPTDTWGASLTPEMIQDPSFGVILKFQGHPYYPHSSGMFIDSVALTVY
jgi:hypothetical protein